MSSDSTAVSSMSRHPGLNWGPTDYEAVITPGRGSLSLVKHRTRPDVAAPHFTRRPQSSRSELERLRAACCECAALGDESTAGGAR